MAFVNPALKTLFALSLCGYVAVDAGAAVGSAALTPRQAEEDFDLAVAAVETGLPKLDGFQSAGEWRAAKQRARLALDHVTDSDQLFRVLRPLLSRIGEGHLSLQRSVAMRQRDQNADGLLPVDVLWTETGARIEAGWGDAADIPSAARLLAIDGEPSGALVDEMMAALGHDGRIRTGAMREASGAGYARVRYWMRGPQASFRLLLQNPAGVIEERVVSGISASVRPVRPASPDSPLARLQWLDEHTALLVVPTFSNRRYREAGSDYRAVIQAVFGDLHARGAKQLVLDLRDNGGGSESNENYLFSFLVGAPLRKYASVQARGASLAVTDASGRRYSVEVYDDEERRRQQRLDNGLLSRRNEAPEGLMSHWSPMSPVFSGRLVVLAGGNTFSGAAELSSMLYHVRRGLFVGEEVGGAHAGNTSGYTWEISLPHSGMELHVPLLRFRFAWNELPVGRGVLPHCPVSPDLPDASRDTALMVARALLSRPWTPAAPPRCPVVLAD